MSPNRLAAAASAYLQSAAHQPVHWFPWGEEAFAAAARLDRPVLLDIGAVWCHWCHVMDGESYEDPALAAFLNEHFICVKVDRDERPDVDARYQRAVQTLTQQGGWPLTAFLTAAGEVFYGGTYFPPDGRYGRPGFRAVLESVRTAYHDRRDEVAAHAEAIRRAVGEGLDEAATGPLEPSLLDDAEAQMLRAFDREHGGFGREPKFPHPAAIAFLLSRWFDAPTDARRSVVERTLQRMARGGIHDQLAGGFHRYSVDREWIVPHFEKMSYDNSELLRIYADAYAVFGDEEYADAARGIVAWVRAVLADPAGGYGASQDADVGLDDDGDYFTWTRDEAAAVLTPAELDVVAAYYDIGTAGEMHHNPGKNVLFVAASVPDLARRSGLPIGEVTTRLASGRERLVAARALRPTPFVDRTRYTAWNAMMAGALLHVSAMLGDAWPREHALLTLQRIRAENHAADAVAHTPSGIEGLLDDQVQTAAAALDAFEVTGESAWLGWSVRIMDRVWRDYADPTAGGLFDTAARTGIGLLPARAKPLQDAPSPSGNGTAAMVAARLGELTGEARWHHRATELLRAFAGRAAELGLHAATYLQAADFVLSPPTHLVVAGPADDPGAERMHLLALARFAPRRVVHRAIPGAVAPPLPAAAAGLAASAVPRAVLCTGLACSAPSSDPGTWARLLDDLLVPGHAGVHSDTTRS